MSTRPDDRLALEFVGTVGELELRSERKEADCSLPDSTDRSSCCSAGLDNVDRSSCCSAGLD
jgi:hypothetical protein